MLSRARDGAKVPAADVEDSLNMAQYAVHTAMILDIYFTRYYDKRVLLEAGFVLADHRNMDVEVEDRHLDTKKFKTDGKDFWSGGRFVRKGATERSGKFVKRDGRWVIEKAESNKRRSGMRVDADQRASAHHSGVFG